MDKWSYHDDGPVWRMTLFVGLVFGLAGYGLICAIAVLTN